MGGKVYESGLTAAQERFCIEVMKPNTTQSAAYRIAFPNSNKWTNKTVAESASRLAKQPAVAARLEGLRERMNQLGVVGVEEALTILSYISRADIRKCFDAEGNLKKPGDIDDHTAIALGEYSAKEGKAKLLNRKEAVETILRWQSARGNMPPPPNGDAAPFEEPNNANDWARRIAFTLHQGAQKKPTDSSTSDGH